MQDYNPDPAAKKVRYTASIIYLLVLGFIVGGSYFNQQKTTIEQDSKENVIWTDSP